MGRGAVPRAERRTADPCRDYSVELRAADENSTPIGTVQVTPDATQVITDNRLLVDVDDGTIFRGVFLVAEDGTAELQEPLYVDRRAS